MTKIIELKNKKFGRLTVIRKYKSIKNRIYWECKCVCGEKKVIRGSHLVFGSVKSCGCLVRELSSERLKAKKGEDNINFKHGMRWSRIYRAHANMLQRSTNKSHPRNKDYISRGISVYKRWFKFENFRDDMYKSYLDHVKKFGEKQTTLDRINNDGNYCKSNCRWATQKIQANNKRKKYGNNKRSKRFSK